MNYKLLFPTYRNRFIFVKTELEKISKKSRLKNILHIGTGEGDYDAMIARYCDHLIACDINESDIDYARTLNANEVNIEYKVEDSLNLTFDEDSFDLVLAVDVIEHVASEKIMLQEIYRVLRPGGHAVLTFPSLEYPITYDPINRLLSIFSDKHISMGAYAFGHDHLISTTGFDDLARESGFAVQHKIDLTKFFAAFFEVYWTGIAQAFLKSNSGNNSKKIIGSSAKLRPSTKVPPLSKITDLILKIDRALGQFSNNSVGKGYILRKL